MIAEMGHVSEGLRLRWFLEFDELGVERVRYRLQNPEEKHRLWGDKGKYAQQWLKGRTQRKRLLTTRERRHEPSGRTRFRDSSSGSPHYWSA